MGIDGEPDKNNGADGRSPDEEISCSLLPHNNSSPLPTSNLSDYAMIIIAFMQAKKFDPFGSAKPHSLGSGIKCRSGSTLSKPQPLGWGVEGLT